MVWKVFLKQRVKVSSVTGASLKNVWGLGSCSAFSQRLRAVCMCVRLSCEQAQLWQSHT